MMKCALVVGHKPSSKGASGSIKVLSGSSDLHFNEFDLNSEVAKKVSEFFTEEELEIVYRNRYRDLPEEINALNPDIIVSMHCNAFNTKAEGVEVLYYHRSTKSRAMAEIFQKHMLDAYGFKDRGILPRNSENRGGYLLRYTKAPCVIVEPFFIDNPNELRAYYNAPERLVNAYVEGIRETFETLPNFLL